MTIFTPAKATGKYFYRYQSAEAERLCWLRPVIVEHRIYLPLASQLNDPNDCRPKLRPLSEEEMVTFLKNDYIRQNPVLALDLLNEHVSRIRASIQAKGLEWFNRELSDIFNRQMEQFRVYSLTKRFDNLSLWAKYAANHTGVCLEFANEGGLFGERTMEVVYEETTPFDILNPEGRNAAFLVHKRPEWSNEEEVRLLQARGSGPVTEIKPQWLTRVILGKDMTDANRKQIREWAQIRQPELTVVQASYDSFRQELRLP